MENLKVEFFTMGVVIIYMLLIFTDLMLADDPKVDSEAKGKPWLGPGLCVARCLGDLKANRCGLIPTPEICMHTVQPTDRFLILASDGVWEFIDNDEAVAIVGQFYDKGLPALDACRRADGELAVPPRCV